MPQQLPKLVGRRRPGAGWWCLRRRLSAAVAVAGAAARDWRPWRGGGAPPVPRTEPGRHAVGEEPHAGQEHYDGEDEAEVPVGVQGDRGVQEQSGWHARGDREADDAAGGDTDPADLDVDVDVQGLWPADEPRL